MKSWISHRIQVISNLYFQCAKFEYDKDHFKQFLWRKQFLTHVKQNSLKTCLSFGVNVLFIVYHEHWVLLPCKYFLSLKLSSCKLLNWTEKLKTLSQGGGVGGMDRHPQAPSSPLPYPSYVPAFSIQLWVMQHQNASLALVWLKFYTEVSHKIRALCILSKMMVVAFII